MYQEEANITVERMSFSSKVSAYTALMKLRLAWLVVFSAILGYMLAPGAIVWIADRSCYYACVYLRYRTMNRRKKGIQILKARVKKANAKLSTQTKPKYISKAQRAIQLLGIW